VVILFGADHCKTFLRPELVDRATYDPLANIFTAKADLVIMDGGGGLIHPDPVEMDQLSHKC